MISLLIAAAAAIATAGTPAAGAPTGSGHDQICKKITYTGSRLGQVKICKTRMEWNEIQAEHDRFVRDQQSHARALDVDD